MTAKAFTNPFRPGAGHMPPYLAGREPEITEFKKLLEQDIILTNLVLTGLRGVGKTVLLESLKPIALQAGWLWVGTDMSESVSISEENMAIRLLTDISVVTSSIVFSLRAKSEKAYDGSKLGFTSSPEEKETIYLSYNALKALFDTTPGLVEDKIKEVLEICWACLKKERKPPKGIIFAYDEAQNLTDEAESRQYPLSLLLGLFQSIQRKNMPLMLVLTGLPTLFPKLVEARTFAERMFHVLTLDKLTDQASKDAVLKPIKQHGCPVAFNDQSVSTILIISGRYPYFIQFICREIYDVFIQQSKAGMKMEVPVDGIIRKLDTDFFSGRWAKATDRQRELLVIIASLDTCDSEFTVQELVEKSKGGEGKPFSSSHANQMLVSLCGSGLVYKNRYGKYSFAVPLLDKYIKRISTASNN
jgi:hypothetical protein